MTCKISRHNLFDCEDVPQAGIGDFFVLINKSDIVSYSYNTISEITAITLLNGAIGYKYDMPKGSGNLTPSVAYRESGSFSGFDHSITANVFDTSQLARKELEKFNRNRVVALIPILAGGFELFGRDVGLTLSELDEMPADSDTGGTINVTISTPDYVSSEPSLPVVVSPSFDIDLILETGTGTAITIDTLINPDLELDPDLEFEN